MPTLSGRYDAEITVTDDGKHVSTHFLKSCFDVRPIWTLSGVILSATTAMLGDAITLTPMVSGDSSDLDYEITVFKNGFACYTLESGKTIEFYPSTAGTYYAVLVATDSYGESQRVKSENIVVEAKTESNPLLSVNYGTTLNIDELEGVDEIVVPAGKNIVLNWNKLAEDSYYRLEIYARSNDSDPSDVDIKNYTSNSYTISVSNLIPGHEYRALLRRYGTSNSVISSVYITFVVGGADSIMLEQRFAAISPVEDAVYTHNDLTVQWTKLNHASKYVLSLESSAQQ